MKNDIRLTTTFISFLVKKQANPQKVGVASVTIVNCYIDLGRHCKFISKLARKCKVLTEDVVRSLSALTYCRDLDKTTLRDLIDSDRKLILEDPQSGMPRVGIPRPPRASMQDLYDKIGRMEIRQDAIERMDYSAGAYNPPGYAQPQYDQYYQQYPPPPPQYQPQQQQDDDE
ncbi:hypothetical protein Tco_0671506 [Tanacetum coccineum]